MLKVYNLKQFKNAIGLNIRLNLQYQEFLTGETRNPVFYTKDIQALIVSKGKVELHTRDFRIQSKEYVVNILEYGQLVIIQPYIVSKLISLEDSSIIILKDSDDIKNQYLEAE